MSVGRRPAGCRARRPAGLYPSGGLAFRASSSASPGTTDPRPGSTMARTGSSGPAVQRVHCPSDCPGILTQRNASSSGFPCSPSACAGAAARRVAPVLRVLGARRGRLHGPCPLRLVSTTKCAVGTACPRFAAYQSSVECHVESLWRASPSSTGSRTSRSGRASSRPPRGCSRTRCTGRSTSRTSLVVGRTVVGDVQEEPCDVADACGDETVAMSPTECHALWPASR